jgi:hypothetical protein
MVRRFDYWPKQSSRRPPGSFESRVKKRPPRTIEKGRRSSRFRSGKESGECETPREPKNVKRFFKIIRGVPSKHERAGRRFPEFREDPGGFRKKSRQTRSKSMKALPRFKNSKEPVNKGARCFKIRPFFINGVE